MLPAGSAATVIGLVGVGGAQLSSSTLRVSGNLSHTARMKLAFGFSPVTLMVIGWPSSRPRVRDVVTTGGGCSNWMGRVARESSSVATVSMAITQALNGEQSTVVPSSPTKLRCTS
jgi:hypothetical protein